MIRYTGLKLDGLQAVQVDAEQGDVLEFTYPEGDTWADMPQHVINAIGTKRVTASNHPAFARMVTAGMTNRGATRNIPNDPGVVQQTIMSPLYRHYCISDPKLRRLTVREIQMAAGNAMLVARGWCLFVGVGSVRIGDEEALPSPTFVDAVDNPATVVALTDVTALYIQRIVEPAQQSRIKPGRP